MRIIILLLFVSLNANATTMTTAQAKAKIAQISSKPAKTQNDMLEFREALKVLSSSWAKQQN